MRSREILGDGGAQDSRSLSLHGMVTAVWERLWHDDGARRRPADGQAGHAQDVLLVRGQWNADARALSPGMRYADITHKKSVAGCRAPEAWYLG